MTADEWLQKYDGDIAAAIDYAQEHYVSNQDRSIKAMWRSIYNELATRDNKQKGRKVWIML